MVVASVRMEFEAEVGFANCSIAILLTGVSNDAPDIEGVDMLLKYPC